MNICMFILEKGVCFNVFPSETRLVINNFGSHLTFLYQEWIQNVMLNFRLMVFISGEFTGVWKKNVYPNRGLVCEIQVPRVCHFLNFRSWSLLIFVTEVIRADWSFVRTGSGVQGIGAMCFPLREPLWYHCRRTCSICLPDLACSLDCMIGWNCVSTVFVFPWVHKY